MKKIFAISLVLVALLVLVSCGSKMTAQDTISKELDLDISGGKEVLNINTYSGEIGRAHV